jgi:hypothetical protein
MGPVGAGGGQLAQSGSKRPRGAPAAGQRLAGGSGGQGPDHLGRIVKTIYILRYIHDEDLRRRNKASYLSLLSNAVLVWNTMAIMKIITELRAIGETIADEDRTRISP